MSRSIAFELTPDNPTYSSGSWQLLGQLNEHIVAVAVFPYNVQTVTELRISFLYARMLIQTYTQRNGLLREYWCTEQTGTSIWQIQWGRNRRACGNPWIPSSAPEGLLRDVRAFQGTGSIATSQGHLITFPTTMEHRVEALELAGPSIPGRYRSVKLYLSTHTTVFNTQRAAATTSLVEQK